MEGSCNKKVIPLEFYNNFVNHVKSKENWFWDIDRCDALSQKIDPIIINLEDDSDEENEISSSDSDESDYSVEY